MDWKHLKSATSPSDPVTLAQSESVMQAGKALMSLLGKVKSVLEVPMLPCPATRLAKRERTNRREPSIVTFFTMCGICLEEGVFTRLTLVHRVLHSFESYHHTLSALVDKDLFGKAPFTFKTKVDYKVRSELSFVAGRNSDCQLLETRERRGDRTRLPSPPPIFSLFSPIFSLTALRDEDLLHSGAFKRPPSPYLCR